MEIHSANEIIEIDGAKLSPLMLRFVKSSQENSNELLDVYVNSLHNILCYAIKSSIEAEEMEKIEEDIVDVIHFLDHLKQFKS